MHAMVHTFFHVIIELNGGIVVGMMACEKSRSCYHRQGDGRSETWQSELWYRGCLICLFGDTIIRMYAIDHFHCRCYFFNEKRGSGQILFVYMGRVHDIQFLVTIVWVKRETKKMGSLMFDKPKVRKRKQRAKKETRVISTVMQCKVVKDKQWHPQQGKERARNTCMGKIYNKERSVVVALMMMIITRNTTLYRMPMGWSQLHDTICYTCRRQETNGMMVQSDNSNTIKRIIKNMM